MPVELLPLAVLLAIAPGYLLIYFATQGRTGRELRPDLHLVVQTLVASAGLIAVIAPFAYATMWPIRNELEKHQWDVLGWLVAIFLLAPFAVGRLARVCGDLMAAHPRGDGTVWIRRVFGHAPEPSLWDWAEVTGVLNGRFVVIEYRDGRRIAGAHGVAPDGTAGVSLTTPEPHGIYLAVEHARVPNGDLVRVANTAGVLVPITDDVRCIHLFNEPPQADGGTAMEHRRRDTPDREEHGIRPHREPVPTHTPTVPEPDREPDRRPEPEPDPARDPDEE
jgi:hypothetical protein